MRLCSIVIYKYDNNNKRGRKINALIKIKVFNITIFLSKYRIITILKMITALFYYNDIITYYIT